MNEMTLEKAMNRLEEITKILESNQSSLENSIELFKEAMELTKYCNEQLNDFETKIATIINE